MRIDPKKLLAHYFNSTWIPFCVYIAALLAHLLSSIWVRFFPLGLGILPKILFTIAAIFFLGIIFASIWNFIRKRWKKGILNLGFTLLSLIITFFYMIFLNVSTLLGPSEDHFADNLSIPDNIEIAEPTDWNDEIPCGLEDGFQKSLIAELKTPDSGIPSVTAQISSLIKLHKNAPDILKRYLSTSLSWRVFKERWDLYARRRWKEEGSQWRYPHNGCYYHDDDSDILGFQAQLTIGFSGKPWWRFSNKNHLKEGQTDNLILSQSDYQTYEYGSRCLISGDEIFFEVFEQSRAKERKLTKTALEYLEKELSPLSDSPSWKTIQTILPSGSIRYGEPSFKLYNIHQPGNYDSQIWINPEEKGMIYLKAYEVTQHHPLTVRQLQQDSCEWIGWSDNPNELFFSNTSFTIYEGDWGKPYAARFEVWFVPDSGAPERKLMEKVFKIEGWQR
jgi:hypothetical protein